MALVGARVKQQRTEQQVVQSSYHQHSQTTPSVVQRQLSSLTLASPEAIAPVGLSDRQTQIVAKLGQALQDPLSTIQVCLESFAQPAVLTPAGQSDLLSVALTDIAYLQFLITELLTYFDEPQATASASPSLQEAPHKPLAILGHELRTPLVAIKICLESLDIAPTEPSYKNPSWVTCQQDMVSMALNNVNRLRDLFQSFLRLSRLQDSAGYYHPEPVNLTQIAEILVSGLQTQQGTVPDIHIDLPPTLPAVYAQEEWITEVLQQLLANACKFTDIPGKITIRLLNPDDYSADLWTTPPHALMSPSLHSKSASPMLTIVVADTGCGIPPPQLRTIFDCFYQVEGALRRTVNGAGIGLTICHQLIQRMGGQIWAQSQGHGYGTQLCFTLPIA